MSLPELVVKYVVEPNKSKNKIIWKQQEKTIQLKQKCFIRKIYGHYNLTTIVEPNKKKQKDKKENKTAKNVRLDKQANMAKWKNSRNFK